MLNLSKKEIRDIFRKHSVKKFSAITSKRFLKFRFNYHHYLPTGWSKNYSRFMVKMMKIAEDKLSIEGLVKLMGGKENIYIYSKIEGFRNGDENGDASYISDSIGKFGSKNVLGPVEALRNKIGMSESEMLAYWLTTRAL